LFGAQDPGNVGGVMRTADYFGADEVWLDRSSADPYSPKGLRGSMGAFLRIPVFRGELGPRIQRFREAGASTCAAIAHGEPSTDVESSDRCILMIGNESRGLAGKELELADHKAKIPGAGRSESLNLGVAAGILIYSALKGKRK
jgi:RNA methyltransferase, TrmH family